MNEELPRTIHEWRHRAKKRRWEALRQLHEQKEEDSSDDDPEQRDLIPDPPKMEPAPNPGATPEILIEKAR